MDTPSQVHESFKIFTSKLGEPFELMADQVSKFAQEKGIAAKSLGIEYVEHEQLLVVTLGYRKDEPAYPIEIKNVSLGLRKGATKLSGDNADLEAAMAAAAAEVKMVICHDIYVLETGEFIMTFLVRKDA